MNALPIIPWIGGKRRLADRLIPLFPQHSCYVQMSALAKSVQGKVMISLNDHPAMREVFADLHIETVDIEYSLGSRHGKAAERGELIITNYDPHRGGGGLF